jgi:colanic acid biosynthesis glycosyl transferase WcaI
MKTLRITVWGINYAPELTGIAPYNTTLCEFLKSNGHSVNMVSTFSYYPEWRKRDEDKGRFFRTDDRNGVPVHRCWHYVPKKPSALKRILHELSFVATSLLRVLTLPKPDVFIVISPPLLLGVAAWIASVLKWTPFIFHVQDLQPDAARSLGMLKPGRLLRLLYALETFAYRKADRVSGISLGMTRALLDKGVPAAKIVYFPNGIELGPAERPLAVGTFRQRMGIGRDQSLHLYAGNLGVKHGVEILLDSACLARDDRIFTVICGDGARREMLQQQARDLNLRNLALLPLQPEKEYQEMMMDADVYIVTQQPGSGSLYFPSKLLRGLALSKPILVVADGQSELTRVAKEAGFAIIVEPNQPEQLAEAQRHLALDSETRSALGAAGRRYVEQFEMGQVLESFHETIRELVGQARVPSARQPASARSKDARPESVS